MTIAIFNTIKKAAGGSTQDDFDITVELSWDTDVQSVAIDETEDVMFRGAYQTQTDDNGYWEVEVVENDNISPVDSVYKITEVERTNSLNINEYYVSVPISATPVELWVGDILVSKPVWEA